MQSYIKILKFILILCSIMNINTKCSKGQYEKLGKCKDCGIGTYSRDGKECEYCSPGTYAPVKGSILCIPCEPGTYTDLVGSSSCEKCPYGTWSDYGSSSCYENMKKEDASNWSYYIYLMSYGLDYVSSLYDHFKDTKIEENYYSDNLKYQKVAQNNL